MKQLIIVESPTKARTISRFVGHNTRVESSFGHVRDLLSSKLSVDVEHNFEPQYTIPKKAKPVVKKLKEEAAKSDVVILATDEDREGEAIAWHLSQALGLGTSEAEPAARPRSKQTVLAQAKKSRSKTSKTPNIERIVFHEITKAAITRALANPRAIDMRLVDAQQARRVLDRLVGYKLSPFLWKKVMRGLSAGRVQSVALRLIVEREKEVGAFVPQTYWTIVAALEKNGQEFTAELISIDGTAIPKPGIIDQKIVETTLRNLHAAHWTVSGLEHKTVLRHPAPPFMTSTLQQAAWQHLGFSAKKTMLVAQQLYEGVDIAGEGATGLITYMRTDSLNVAEEALANAGQYIKKTFGDAYAPPQPRRFKTKSKGAQEAHEAIRPTDPTRASDDVRINLSRDQYRLYELIWRRFIASQMQPAIFESTTVVVAAAATPMSYVFRARGVVLRFDGFLRVFPSPTKDIILPELQKDDALTARTVRADEHQTQPPSRYTEASLVKTLEKFGIGRPSTYAPTMSVIQERNYVKKDEQKHFVPTEIGVIVTDLLVEHFPNIVDVAFTAHMEDTLDDIAEGKTAWQPIIREFYEPFAKNLENKYGAVEKKDLSTPTGEVCERCGKPMVEKYGRFGKFIACSGFPECKNTKRIPPVSLHIPCPDCKSGEIVVRKGRRGRTFYGCSRYPDCSFALWKKPTGEQCPVCAALLVEDAKGVSCSNKDCGYKKK